MEFTLRTETPSDYQQVEELIAAAFQTAEFTDHREHLLVARLRKTPSFIPELSIVAEWNDQLIGHILLTKIQISNKSKNVQSLALAPVSVLPDFQRKGLGAALIQAAHQVATKLDFGSVILLGHADYYPRFGYQKASTFNILLPFEAPDENCMAIELFVGALKDVSGTVVYDPAFYE